MQIIIDGIRNIVVLVLLMELVLQMQSGKQYEPYIKMLVGIMVVYSLVTGMFGVFELDPMQDFRWSSNWFEELQEEKERVEEFDVSNLDGTIHIEEIKSNISIDKITVSPVEIGNK